MRFIGIVTNGVASNGDGPSDFGFLSDVNGFPAVEMTARTLLDGGAEHVYVVSGETDGDVATCLDGNVTTLVQSNRTSFAGQVAAALEIALRESGRDGEIDGIAILPFDMPSVKPSTVFEVVSSLSSNDATLPRLEGESGFPIAVRANLLADMLKAGKLKADEPENGTTGSAEFAEKLSPTIVETNDSGTVLRGSDPSGPSALLANAARQRGVSLSRCEELFDEAQTPQNVREHCATTSRICRRMARNLNGHGYHLDTELCASGGMLHDIKRVERVHSRKGRTFLCERGYDALAQIVLDHDGFMGVCPRDFTESSIVCYADKHAQDDKIVSIEDRYYRATSKFPPDTPVGERLRLDVFILNLMKSRYEEITGDRII
ncbi:MAG: NTP transferase domain-containing protein [Coriobacteriales bacterium]